MFKRIAIAVIIAALLFTVAALCSVDPQQGAYAGLAALATPAVTHCALLC